MYVTVSESEPSIWKTHNAMSNLDNYNLGKCSAVSLQLNLYVLLILHYKVSSWNADTKLLFVETTKFGFSRLLF